MEVGVADLADGTGDVGTKEFGHQIDVVTGEVGMV